MQFTASHSHREKLNKINGLISMRKKIMTQNPQKSP